ncbi:MAG: hypothetical protein A4E60_02072 [Syntrophorhabdus sp. PtaB.Bin047]|nr:MAG: hypothetical protein A4E60_02072 [Syntrophorhabdus sp. PtaB.Bin047]
MALQEEIKQVFSTVPAQFSEKKGVTTVEYVVAERKSFLSKKKVTYIAKYRVVEDSKEVRFTEMLKESGSGISSGGFDDDSPSGFGFKKETYKTGMGGREGTIEEQSNLLGGKYSYKFDFKATRAAVQKKVEDAGYTFKYQITPIGL